MDKEEPQIFTRWIDPTINEYKQQITQLTNNWNELEEWVKNFSVVNYNCDEIIVHEQIILNFVLTKMKEIKEKNNE